MVVQKSNVISIGSADSVRRSRVGDRTNPLAVSIRKALSRQLRNLLQNLFDNLDDVLFERADKAGNSQEAEQYFDAMRQVRKFRGQVSANFIDATIATFDGFWIQGAVLSGAGGSVDFTASELSLVDKSEEEEDLAITNLATKAENLFREGLFAIEQRLGHLAASEISHTNNPLSPRHIAEAFRDATKELPVELTVRLVIYKLFDRCVTSDLEPLYDEINILMIQAGVMPHLAYQPRRNESGQVTLPPAEAGQTTQEQVAEIAGKVTSEVFNGLRELLQQRREVELPTSVPGTTVITGGTPYSLDELVQTLNGLQVNTRVEAGQTAVVGLRALVLTELPGAEEEKAKKDLAPEEADAIDLVDMLFQFILDDDTLADGMRAQIARLQIPLLKAAILDKAVFNDEAHPARLLLNELAKAAIGWSETDGRTDGGLFKRVETVVEGILSGFQRDVSVFQRLLDEFRAKQEEEARATQQFESRASQVARGQETLAIAKLRVGKAIEARMLDREVPEFIATMLRDGWSALLVLIHLREGEESESWKRNLAAVDDLLWSTEPKSRPQERQELISKMPALLKCFREGLNNISYDPYGIAHFFKQLQGIHLQRLSAAGNPAAAAPKPVVKKAKPVPADAAQPEAPKKDEFDRMVDELKTGTWLELVRDDGGRIRAKLAWRSPTTARCLLVNRRGLKVEELDSAQLADRVRKHSATILTNASLFDRALDAIGSALSPRHEHP